MLEIILSGIAALAAVSWALFRSIARNRANRAKIKGFEKRREIDREIDKMDDADRHAAGNEWL